MAPRTSTDQTDTNQATLLMAEPREFLCIPMHLEPHQRLGFTRCELISGLTLTRLSDELHTQLGLAKNGVRRSFHPNYAVLADVAKYREGVQHRLRSEGQTIPAEPAYGWTIAPTDLVRHTLVSLILLQRFRFIVGGSFKLETDGGTYRVSSYQHIPEQEASRVSIRALPMSPRPTINRAALHRIALLLDPYYRTGLWQVDRLAVALNSLWAGICTPFLDHTFVSLTIVLEALLSDGGPEVTHKLSERIAALTVRTRTARPQRYKQVKVLYGIRSRLVHGDMRVRKGAITPDSLHISAKNATVPAAKLDELGIVVNEVLHAVLRRRELVEIIQKRQSEEQTTRDLDDFFLNLTLA